MVYSAKGSLIEEVIVKPSCHTNEDLDVGEN
jgi:hypothetical protein